MIDFEATDFTYSTVDAKNRSRKDAAGMDVLVEDDGMVTRYCAVCGRCLNVTAGCPSRFERWTHIDIVDAVVCDNECRERFLRQLEEKRLAKLLWGRHPDGTPTDFVHEEDPDVTGFIRRIHAFTNSGALRRWSFDAKNCALFGVAAKLDGVKPGTTVYVERPDILLVKDERRPRVFHIVAKLPVDTPAKEEEK